MIGKLTGTYGGTTAEGAVVIEVNGVGYVARVPLFAIDRLKASTGIVSLYIHTAVREDAIDLYGFTAEDELLFFKQLMSVSGIGPKTAVGILNVSDVATLRRNIAAGDASALTKIFGIGKKSAERIVVELRDKLALEQTARGEASTGTFGGNDGEVIEALIALGYSASEARSVIKELPPELRTGTVNERLSAALKSLGSHSKTK
ncbi:MAG TPA: Holliday junction branch migration protein RuvA [Candidatus Paceibacterota bacterium]|nr:Holliday junction branch migration protein RuvA [Candidatus Paceibacterota bacterium]